MPSINMIAPRRSEKKRLESNTHRLLALILLEVVLILGVSAFMITRIYTTRSGIQGLDLELTKLQPTVKKIEACDKMAAELKPKVDTLNQAKNSTMTWCRVLDSLSTCLPGKTWLTKIATGPATQDNKELTLNLSGVSASQELVGDAMLRMHDNVRDFSRIDLHYTQRSTLGAGTAVDFEIGAAVGRPNESSPTQEVKKS